jgi:aspartyl-tRNA(Asn)/glutamyl-tRNA(Gln) amidotransferase subunit A
MDTDLALLSATELIAAYRSKALSPVEVTQACLDRIERLDPVLNAFVEVRPGEALAAAERSEKRWLDGEEVGLVDGVPTAIKDLTPMAGYPFRRGSVTTSGEICSEDGPCVKRLREERAIFLGKTTTPEFGWKGVTDSPLTGVTRNPWNPDRTPGGSSGGAASSVASGMAVLAEGTDGGGSIRMPAGFTGVFGLYPTAGRIPYYPLSVLGTMSQCGPMTRTVADGALMFTAMAGPDPRDPVGLPANEVDWRPFLHGGLDGLRVAFSPTLGYAKVDPGVAAVVDRAVRDLGSLGARIEQVDRVFDDPREPYETLFRVGMERIRQTVPDDRRHLMDPGLLEMAAEGREVSLLSYAEAETARGRWAAILNGLFQRYDVLVTPQLPITAFEAGLEYPAGTGMRRWLDWNPFGYPFNFTNSPAGTMPCGLLDGLPVAFQVVAPRYREDLIFRVCGAFEKHRPIPLPDLSATLGVERRPSTPARHRREELP